MKSLFEFYGRALRLSKQRAALLGKRGAFFPETMTQFGTFAGGHFGWGAQAPQGQGVTGAVNCTGVASISGGGRVAWADSNRYHREGGLELSLLALDFLDYSGDERYFGTELLEQIVEYVDYYTSYIVRQKHNGTRARAGAGAGTTAAAAPSLDIFPGQALETWMCTGLPRPSRNACVTNPMPEIAGLHAVLPRMLHLHWSNGTAVLGNTTRRRHRWVRHAPVFCSIT